ncbi:hypothetical protein SCP_0401030 [Sparassis crispa]|uniref:Uncharacterized protein n=1 Tax=Sparassis crispa TaxID=139825 RepID=A0A401GHT3_9APHY|nr:hypothetical protein SCP_0401030 [Sparassis crispa]GBE81732.1 hypothetical protein SCP_0401030 [Sparassis crispa]
MRKGLASEENSKRSSISSTRLSIFPRPLVRAAAATYGERLAYAQNTWCSLASKLLSMGKGTLLCRYPFISLASW